MTLSDLRRLIRLEQWYKNLVVFLPAIFFETARSGGDVWLAVLGFCCVSSVTYLINDWVDRGKDRHHPTKKERPLASGRVSGKQAIAVGSLLALLVVLIGLRLGEFYWWPIGLYFLATNLYSLGLKNLPLLDILMIAGNFMLRMLGGMEEWPHWSQWGPFLFVFIIMILFLSHKRRSDIKLLGKAKAYAHKPVLKFYRRPVVYALRVMSYFALLWTMWMMEWPVAHMVGLMILVLMTSHEFVNDAKLVLKPHHLLMRHKWILAFIVALGLVLFS